jgi:3-hydroxyethyl bacteriochlorophyllide a dehydrogenase
MALQNKHLKIIIIDMKELSQKKLWVCTVRLNAIRAACSLHACRYAPHKQLEYQIKISGKTSIGYFVPLHKLSSYKINVLRKRKIIMSKVGKAIVFEKVNKVAIKKIKLPECGPSEIVCETVYTFVSPGTELRVLGGNYVSAKDFPLIPGYSVIARVIELGSEVKGFRAGDLISGRNPRAVPGINSKWGGQASAHVYTTIGEYRPVLLPHNAEPLDYVIAEVAAISSRGVEAANPVAGETAIVIGQGLIGAFSAAWLMDRGCRVIVCDVNNERLQKASERGISEFVNMSAPDAMERLSVICNGGADIVVESSGTATGALTAYKLLRKKPQAYGADYKVEPIAFYHNDWPRLIMQANYIEKISIDPFGFMPGEGVTILAPKDRGVEDRQKVIEAIRCGRIKASDFIDAVLPFEQAAEGYAGLQKQQYFSVVYKW